MKTKILVADDESKIRDLLSDFLTEEGFEVITACDGQEAIELFELHEDIALVVLDVMMPIVDGWEVCKEVRRLSTVPVIMLTAKSAESDELEGFEKGADDYITKPFSLSVLLARIQARLTNSVPIRNGVGNIIKYGELLINLETHDVEINGRNVGLTPIEYELLTVLCKNKGKVFSRQQLLATIWGYDYYGGDRTVDTHIGRLRVKLGENGDHYVKTVRGYGYKFESHI